MSSTLVLLAALTAPVCGLAQSSSASTDTARQARVEQLFQVMHLEKTFDQIMNQVMEQNQAMVRSLFPGSELSPAQKTEYDAFMGRVDTVIRSTFSWSALEPEFVKLYADTYTDGQVADIIAFYQTPTGAAMVEKTPEVLKQSSALAMAHMNQLAPQLRELMEQEMNKLKSAGAPARQPTGN